MIQLSKIVQEMEIIEGISMYVHRPSFTVVEHFEEAALEDQFTAEEIAELEKDNPVSQGLKNAPEDYLAFPSKYDIHEYRIMENFCHTVANDRVKEALLNSIRGSGAFRRFRNTLDKANQTDKWYHFRKRAFYEIAAEWCIEHDILYTDDRPAPKRTKKKLSPQKIFKDWTLNAQINSDQNFNFLTSLKLKTEDRVDQVAIKMHNEAFKKIDCTTCGNCCKKMKPELQADDIKNIADFLKISTDQVEQDYLTFNEKEKSHEFNALPCPFLGTDNFCSIYEARPVACRDFPNTDESRFAASRLMHHKNTLFCPITYYVVERMKEHFQ